VNLGMRSETAHANGYWFVVMVGNEPMNGHAEYRREDRSGGPWQGGSLAS
jgi:hypothetical protein